jgi:hypothetical protein
MVLRRRAADAVDAVISDMLVEADPRRFLPEEVNPNHDRGKGDSPIDLFNRALGRVPA